MGDQSTACNLKSPTPSSVHYPTRRQRQPGSQEKATRPRRPPACERPPRCGRTPACELPPRCGRTPACERPVLLAAARADTDEVGRG
eukprot:356896-Chlamydomonas_euryale.AAC.5